MPSTRDSLNRAVDRGLVGDSLRRSLSILVVVLGVSVDLDMEEVFIEYLESVIQKVVCALSNHLYAAASSLRAPTLTPCAYAMNRKGYIRQTQMKSNLRRSEETCLSDIRKPNILRNA